MRSLGLNGDSVRRTFIIPLSQFRSAPVQSFENLRQSADQLPSVFRFYQASPTTRSLKHGGCQCLEAALRFTPEVFKEISDGGGYYLGTPPT